MNLRRIAVLGAGAWGTALAVLWATGGREVILWGHDAKRINQLKTTRENTAYLPGISLPEELRVTNDLEACEAADLVVIVTPSTSVREIAQRLRPFISNAVLMSCTKGIEYGTGLRMSEILTGIFPNNTVAVLSGPNLATEVAKGLPTATVLGCKEPECGQELQQYLGSPHFRIYSSDEMIGIELGGALKNVFAITAGASDGLGLGDNSKAALVTRCLAELLRLGTAMGGNPRTFYGLSGAGDLMATCFSQLSRNRRVGEELARGRPLAQITAAMRTVAEGIPTTKSAYECARRLGVETPIIDQAYAVLYQGRQPADALQELLGRDPKSERI